MRLIDADTLPKYTGAALSAVDVARAVETAPTIDPVKHGEWIWDDEGFHCSDCFYHAYGNTGEVLMGYWNYCPNCGARMDGGEG